jgi:RNA polymerase-binding transcription factor DksA
MLDNKIILLTTVILLLIWERTKNNKNVYLDTLLRQSARYAIAAQQDESPLIAVLHINYAAAYFYASKDIASDNEIFNATGIDVHEYKQHLSKIQDAVSRQAYGACPEFIGEVELEMFKEFVHCICNGFGSTIDRKT